MAMVEGSADRTRFLIRAALGFVLLLFFSLHTSEFLPISALSRAEMISYDFRVRSSLREETGDRQRVVVLDMDERTLAVEGWPLPRDRIARLMDLLFDQYEIDSLASDIVFSEADRSDGADMLARLAEREFADLPGFRERAAALLPDLDNDRRLAEALKGRNVVLGYFFKSHLPEGEGAETGAICTPAISADDGAGLPLKFVEAVGFGANLPVLQAATPYCGFFNNDLVDTDGVYRRVPLLQRYQGGVYPSLALALTRLSLGNPPIELVFDPPGQISEFNLEAVRLGDYEIPVDREVAALVPYRGEYGSYPYVSVTDVLEGRADADILKDALVLMGTSAAGLLDLRTTPVGHNFPGVEVHANLVSGVFDQRFKHRAPYYIGIEFIMLTLVTLMFGALVSRLSPLAQFGLGIGAIAGIIGIGQLAWHSANFVMPVGVPVVFVLILLVIHQLYGYFIESRRVRETQNKFGQYVPPEVVAQIADSGKNITMEGESREMTVLFTDVRGFTSISENLDARELAEMMNRFLTKQTGVIRQFQGTIDKYMGDAIMAFWGAPLADEDHAMHALRAGLEMVRAVRQLDDEFVQRGWKPINIGVGINTGRMNVGNMGSEFRVAYTAMGDAVNLGSRVEGLTKVYGANVMCTEDTRNAASGNWAYRELDLVKVVGKSQPVSLYEPLGPKEELDAELRSDLARHRGALRLFRARQWDKAELEFHNLNTGPRPHKSYQIMLDRIAAYRQIAPPEDWDGAYQFQSK